MDTIVPVNRLGDLHVDAIPNQPHVALDLALLSPNGRSLATGTNKIAFPIALRDLHLAQLEGPFWHLKITAPGNVTNLKCDLTVQVHDTVRLPAAVLQQRLDAVIGNASSGNYIVAAVDYDDQKRKNVVSRSRPSRRWITSDLSTVLKTLTSCASNGGQRHRQARPNQLLAPRAKLDEVEFNWYGFKKTKAKDRPADLQNSHPSDKMDYKEKQ